MSGGCGAPMPKWRSAVGSKPVPSAFCLLTSMPCGSRRMAMPTTPRAGAFSNPFLTRLSCCENTVAQQNSEAGKGRLATPVLGTCDPRRRRFRAARRLHRLQSRGARTEAPTRPRDARPDRRLRAVPMRSDKQGNPRGFAAQSRPCRRSPAMTRAKAELFRRHNSKRPCVQHLSRKVRIMAAMSQFPRRGIEAGMRKIWCRINAMPAAAEMSCRWLGDRVEKAISFVRRDVNR